MKCPPCLTDTPATTYLTTLQNHFKKGMQALFCAAMMLGAILLFGCSDSGGSGPPGPAGPTGPPSPEIPPVATTTETCSLCHGTGKIADIAVAHPDPTGQAVTLSNITLTNTAGFAQVTFHAATATGSVTDLTLDDVRFMIANLVPALTPASGDPKTPGRKWDTPYFERWAYERNGTDRQGNDYLHGDFVNTDAANGNYAYTFL
ncbi:MAG: hypothetical protein WB818_02455, partial [Desulfobacterales bacterium]